MTPDGPIIVQSDFTILLDVHHPGYLDGRDLLMGFAELVKSPDHFHTYRITPLSLWNAAASGFDADGILGRLEQLSRYPIPGNVAVEVREQISRWGRVRVIGEGRDLMLTSDDGSLLDAIWNDEALRSLLGERLDSNRITIPHGNRGPVKRALTRLGFPADDQAGYRRGESLDFELRPETLTGEEFTVRDYQRRAADSFWSQGGAAGGAGVVVLPCGAGKTIVGIACMALARTHTLILTTSTTAVRQWVRELVDRTTLEPDQIAEYTGAKKSVKPVTVTTYQMMTYRPPGGEVFPHFELFTDRGWGLIIYDEVHLLPAPIFRITAELQATRRLGLTATLVREDNREDDVFSLVGPKKYDIPWRELEKRGWIAAAACTEVRISLPDEIKSPYAIASRQKKFRLASENPRKSHVVKRLLEFHRGDQVLIIGHYIDQLKRLTAELSAPIITGGTPQKTRDVLFDDFRSGKISVLIISKVGNFAIDLPDANVLIQVSGTFGSRQEEAQRLGRVLRPKSDGATARFYSLVTRDTKDQDYSMNRQLFLTEQGYAYRIVDETELDALLCR